MNSHFWNVLVVVMQASAVILLALCVMEFRKRTVFGRLIGVACLAFAVFFGCVAQGLNIINTTWHLRNSQKPWTLQLILGGVGLISCFAGSSALVKVVRVREEDSEPILSLEDTEVSDEVWPPPPRKP